MRKEYAFYLTDEQIDAITKTGIVLGQLQFGGDGMISAISFGDNDVSFYTFRRDGSYAIETRDFTSAGWEKEEFTNG